MKSKRHLFAFSFCFILGRLLLRFLFFFKKITELFGNMFGHVERPAFLKLKASFPNGSCHMCDRVSKRVLNPGFRS